MADQLLLDVIAGSLKGQTFVVSSQDQFLVGRLPECGMCVPDDLTVSRQHFRIDYSSRECRLIHISQTGGTNINDCPVSEALLRQGDEISFGMGNRLKVRFASKTQNSERSTVTFDKFLTSKIPSGWNEHHSLGEHPTIVEILTILESRCQIYALIDFRKIGDGSPPTLENAVPLFGWLPPELAVKASPTFVMLDEIAGVQQILQAGWLKGAIVCFGSNLSFDELLAHWRSAIGAEGNQPGESMTAFFSPAILQLILAHQSTDQVRFLLSKLTWLLVASTEQPCQWALYCQEEFTGSLTSMGMINE